MTIAPERVVDRHAENVAVGLVVRDTVGENIFLRIVRIERGGESHFHHQLLHLSIV